MKVQNSVLFLCHVTELSVKDNGTNTMATIRESNYSKDKFVITVTPPPQKKDKRVPLMCLNDGDVPLVFIDMFHISSA